MQTFDGRKMFDGGFSVLYLSDYGSMGWIGGKANLYEPLGFSTERPPSSEGIWNYDHGTTNARG